MPSIQTAYNWAIETCAAPNVGYSQAYRNQRTVKGVTYYDCSSFIWYALLAGGFDCVKANGNDTWPFVTSTMARCLPLLGFKRYAPTQPWKPGDILLRTGHTEMAFDKNHTMGAHSSKYPLEQQVSINSNPTSAKDWLELYRYEEGAKSEWVYGNRYLSMGEMQNNAKIIFQYFLSKNWTVNAIAGMLGNFQKESTINPGIWQNLNPDNPELGWGLAQWTPSTKYTDWADANGYPRDDGNYQLLWLHGEMEITHEWIPTNDYPLSYLGYQQSVESPEYLAYAWLNEFERPSDRDQPDRQQYARYWYDWYQGDPVPPPNPNPEPDWSPSMPIWMALRNYERR